MRRYLLTVLTAMLSLTIAHAQNWDDIQGSGEYYYGVGHGSTTVEATEHAMADMTSMIATHVSSEFVGIDDATNTNGSVDHQSRVLNCVRTYSQSALTNVERWQVSEEPNAVVRCYIKRTELARIYDNRIAKAKDMILIAEESLRRGKLDMTLQYYYWAYSLLRSVQRPNEVKDSEGRILINWLPLKINEILSAISVTFEKRDGDFVDLLFNYNGLPVSSLEFSYSDGRAMCQGSAKDGRGMMEMAPGYETEVYHVNIEYEYKGQARGDAEMQSVLDVITRKVFPKTVFSVRGAASGGTSTRTSSSTISGSSSVVSDISGVSLTPSSTQIANNSASYENIANKVIEAIRVKNNMEASRYFTFEGKEVFRELIGYGTGRVVGTPHLQFFKSRDGRVVCRGLQMSFSFNRGTKKTFVEDVVFTFNSDMQIENVAFGLGQVAESDILCRQAPGWKDETREMLMEFLENYKTAFCLKRLDYIRDIFADDAVIIIGNVAHRTVRVGSSERPISIAGQELIQYNRYTKDQYLRNLATCFNRNEFINLRFGNNDIQWLEKYPNEEIFAIQISQEYNSSSYGDKGYLFLLVNMTNHEQPQIKIRTWQPNEVDMRRLYNAGDFYNE